MCLLAAACGGGVLGSPVRLACWSSGDGDGGTTGSAVRMGPGETSQEVDE